MSMRILAISGSARAASTNTALLRALQAVAPPEIKIEVFSDIAALPVFSPDMEGALVPAPVQALIRTIQACDGLLISSPEYVRAIPGGLKNAIDWLVSGEQIVAKPIALVHASHRGDDMLESLRLVLSTVSARFNPELFLRLSLMKQTPESIHAHVMSPDVQALVRRFLRDFVAFCRTDIRQPQDM